MSWFAETEHFAGAPHWTWYVLVYFFVAGLAGGCYFLATFLRYWGTPADEPAARFGLNLNTTTPMSIGVWALVVGSIFALVAFVDALVHDRKIRHPVGNRLAALLEGTAGRVFHVVGAILYLFIAGYTGVLLAVSNQPVWSDTWALGGLFLASGLSGSAALLLLLMARYRRDAEPSRAFLELCERIFAALELLMLLVFVITLIDDGALDEAFALPWIPLWLLAVAGMLPGLSGLASGRLRVTGGGTLVAERTAAWVAAPALVLVGVLALRAAVIFSAQA
jgi:formate-dependent nitrite reductase membrane component NrfD